jgi:hypothetical protein
MLAGVAAASAAPMYWLALSMPVGLTRGMAIGGMFGVLTGVLQRTIAGGAGRRVQLLTRPAVTVFLVVSAAVLAVGRLQVGWHQAVVDGVELATSLGLATFVAAGLLHLSRWRATALVLATAVVGASCTTYVAALTHFDDPDRGPASLLVGVGFGVGIATVAARISATRASRVAPPPSDCPRDGVEVAWSRPW